MAPRYNIAPGQEVLALYPDQQQLCWGRIGWGFPPLPGRKAGFLVNARAETVAEKQTFREAFRHRRCLVPADGFFEWLRSAREPWFFKSRNGDPLGLAGIWKVLPLPAGGNLRALVILTREAVPPVTAVHHRMPVIIRESEQRSWLDPETSPERLQVILRHPGPELVHHPVSREVNRTGPDHPGLVDALPGIPGELFD